jgi:hypothetical protein
MKFKKYGKRFFCNPRGEYRIPDGVEVELLGWGKNRRCLIEWNGERIVTYGGNLRKMKPKRILKNEKTTGNVTEKKVTVN